ncbi:MAG TPA: hypothetical protein VK797_22645 [Tepidisphaeraceae bacterium]|jgi:hypothetical protein|nr:hypothetical protein [Tepidisphaeraceae bacterium]
MQITNDDKRAACALPDEPTSLLPDDYLIEREQWIARLESIHRLKRGIWRRLRDQHVPLMEDWRSRHRGELQTGRRHPVRNAAFNVEPTERT